MTRSTFVRGAFATGIVLLAIAAGYWTLRQGTRSAVETPPPIIAPPATEPLPLAETQGFLYGRITTVDGAVYEGRMRWGEGDQEAFWGDYFLGTRRKNPWLARMSPEQRPRERRPIEIFGIEIAHKEVPSEAVRLLMVRFGEIARIEGRSNEEVRVTLKSGTVVDLDRFQASDFDDGLRVWDTKQGVVDLDSLRIRTVELLPTPSLNDVPRRLYGTVRTRQGAFTGFVHWNREEGVGSDELDGRTADGKLGLRFDTIRSIARRSRDSARVTLLDGREIMLSDVRSGDNPGSRGTYVDDPRYGRVLISWDLFERLDFSPGGGGPAYGDFPPGRPLMGGVTTRAGRRLDGRLVYDLDESETTDTLDAPSRGVDYIIPFRRIASIGLEASDPQRARVVLRSGEELRLERTGDLGERNLGILVFVDGRPRPEYVPWTDVEQIDLAGTVTAPRSPAPSSP